MMAQNSGVTDRLLAVSFVNEEVGTAVGDVVLHTTDGGATRTRQTRAVEPLLAVSFVNVDVGTAVGPGIYRTTNGGVTWMSQDVPTHLYLYGVSFVDEGNGTVVGTNGTILRTNTRGQ